MFYAGDLLGRSIDAVLGFESLEISTIGFLL